MAFKASQHPVFSDLDSNEFLVFAQFNANTTGQLIPDSLRLSFLENLEHLSRDDLLKHDFRDALTGQYLNPKTLQFALTRRVLISAAMSQGGAAAALASDPAPVSVSVPIDIDIHSAKAERCFPVVPDSRCWEVRREHRRRSQRDYNQDVNTAFIHELIDPNRGLNESRLWIPSIFNCQARSGERMIKSPILNLDFVRYTPLYADIGKVFKLALQPMVENVLGYELGRREKVIVKSMRYVLQKPGDKFEGTVHREGMGENIVAVAIYYPQVSSRKSGMRGGALRLRIPKASMGQVTAPYHEFEIEEGSAVAFLNDGVHQVPHIEYIADEKDAGPIVRTVLAFFIVNRNNSEHVVASDGGPGWNRDLYWRYVVRTWLRDCALWEGSDFAWMMELVCAHLFEDNYAHYVHDMRCKMRDEKRRTIRDDPKRRKIRRFVLSN